MIETPAADVSEVILQLTEALEWMYEASPALVRLHSGAIHYLKRLLGAQVPSEPEAPVIDRAYFDRRLEELFGPSQPETPEPQQPAAEPAEEKPKKAACKPANPTKSGANNSGYSELIAASGGHDRLGRLSVDDGSGPEDQDSLPRPSSQDFEVEKAYQHCAGWPF
jgi:hypothetical protein